MSLPQIVIRPAHVATPGWTAAWEGTPYTYLGKTPQWALRKLLRFHPTPPPPTPRADASRN